MARVGRIAGAILAETEGRYYLVGNTKKPCDWAAAGFEAPTEIDALKRPYMPLLTRGPVDLGGAHLTLGLEGEELVRRLAECFVIRRTGSVSERLWRLVVCGTEEDDVPEQGTIDARWLGEMPLRVWQVVQDTVLRCV
jgi:hypothetical protein